MFKVRRSRSVSSVFNHQVSNKVLFATDQGEGMPALRYQSRLWALLLFDRLACYSTCAHCLSCCCWLTCYQLHMSCPPTNQLINCFTCALNLSWLHARHMLCPQPFLQMWRRLVRTLTRFRQGDCFHVWHYAISYRSVDRCDSFSHASYWEGCSSCGCYNNNTCCTTEIEAIPIMTISSDADIPMSQWCFPRLFAEISLSCLLKTGLCEDCDLSPNPLRTWICNSTHDANMHQVSYRHDHYSFHKNLAMFHTKDYN